MNATRLDVLMNRAAGLVDGWTEGKTGYLDASRALYELEQHLDDGSNHGATAIRMGHTLLAELEEKVRAYNESRSKSA